MAVLHQSSSLYPPQFSQLHSHKVFPLVSAFLCSPPPHVITVGQKHCFCVPDFLLHDNVFLFNFSLILFLLCKWPFGLEKVMLFLLL